MLAYKFEFWEEMLWAGLVGVGVFGLQLLIQFEPNDVIANWETYLISAGGGMVRAFAAAAIIVFRPRKTS